MVYPPGVRVLLPHTLLQPRDSRPGPYRGEFIAIFDFEREQHFMWPKLLLVNQFWEDCQPSYLAR